MEKLKGFAITKANWKFCPFVGHMKPMLLPKVPHLSRRMLISSDKSYGMRIKVKEYFPLISSPTLLI